MNTEIEIAGMDAIEQENTSIDDIDSEDVNLIFVGIDRSGSMYDYEDQMKNSLEDFKDAIANSKESDDILVARADFNHDFTIGGYKKINEFDTDYESEGGTALYDMIKESTKKLIDYMDYLRDQGTRVKAVYAIFSDGEDLHSRYASMTDASNCINSLNKKEIITSFVEFGSSAYGIADDLGFRNKLKVGSSSSELRKAFACLSKSVIEASKSVVASNDGDFFVM